MKQIIFWNVSSLLKYIQTNSLSNQINRLLTESFPDVHTDVFLPVDQMMCVSKKIITFMRVSVIERERERERGKQIIAFGQFIQDDEQKIRLINYCREPNVKYKGQGTLMLQSVMNLVAERMNVKRFYLHVDAMNIKLQDYYKSIGWIDTHKYAVSRTPQFEYVKIHGVT